MTFAEIAVFVLFVLGIYFLLRPLRLLLERIFYRFLRGKSQPQGTIIDITDSLKKKDSPK